MRCLLVRLIRFLVLVLLIQEELVRIGRRAVDDERKGAGLGPARRTNLREDFGDLAFLAVLGAPVDVRTKIFGASVFWQGRASWACAAGATRAAAATSRATKRWDMGSLAFSFGVALVLGFIAVSSKP